MIGLALLTIVTMGLVVLAMSVGVMISGRCLRGSCGGPAVLDGNGDPLSCAACPNRPSSREHGAASG